MPIGARSISMFYLVNNTSSRIDSIRAVLRRGVFDFADTSQLSKPLGIGYETSIKVRFIPTAPGIVRDTIFFYIASSEALLQSVPVVGTGVQ